MRVRVRGGTAIAGLLLAAVLGLGAGSAHAAPAAHKPCAVRGSTTVERNAQVRVFTRSAREDESDHRLVGCLLASGRRLLLDSWFSCDCSRGDENEPQTWLRGTVVAVNRYGCSPDPSFPACSGGARTVDLRTRRTLRRASTGGYVSELAIGPAGTIAVVTGRGLVTSDAAGEVVLDAGPGIQPGSLAFAGPLLYWTSGGAPRSALLTP